MEQIIQKEKKSLNRLIIWNSFGFLTTIGFSICATIFFVAWAKWNTTTDIHYWWDGAVTIMTWCLVIGILIFVAQLIMNIIFSIKLLTNNWQCKWCKENRKLWGLLSLFLLGWIGIYIFSFIGKKHAKNQEEYIQNNHQINNNYYNQQQNYNQYPTNQFNDFYQQPYQYPPYNNQQPNQNNYPTYPYPPFPNNGNNNR